MQSRGKSFRLYSSMPSPYAVPAMFMIAAALEEELKTALDIFQDVREIPPGGIRLRHALHREREFWFLKTGIGPKRAASSLERVLASIKPSRILVVGYGGGLDAELKLGSLIAVEKALTFRFDPNRPEWESGRIDGVYGLADPDFLLKTAISAGVASCTGAVLTSPHVLGDPVHKATVYRKFGASIVDMETAALARVATSRGIPLSCVRAISDEAGDALLAPFSYDPTVGIPSRAVQVVSAGMRRMYKEWKEHTAVARENLRRFLLKYLENAIPEQTGRPAGAPITRD